MHSQVEEASFLSLLFSTLQALHIASNQHTLSTSKQNPSKLHVHPDVLHLLMCFVKQTNFLCVWDTGISCNIVFISVVITHVPSNNA